MTTKTVGIILKLTRFNESSCIVQAFTNNLGKISFIVNGVFGKRPKYNISQFHCLNIVELVLSTNSKSQLPRLTELRTIEPLIEIQTHIFKNTIAQFITEIIDKTIHEENADNIMFDFLQNSIFVLEHSSKVLNFHIIFLCLYSKHLGIYPYNNFSEINNRYNIEQSQFVSYCNQNCIKPIDSAMLSDSLKYSYNDINSIEIDNEQRRILLKLWIEIYQQHFENLKNVKSLEVLKDIFA